MEVWKDIKGYEGMYQISSLGRVKSLKRKGCINDRVLKQNASGRGYLTVELYRDKKPITFRVHQLVAAAFLNHTPCGMKVVVDHLNCIKTDNRAINLQLVTQRKNASKDRKDGTSKHIGVSWYKPSNKWRVCIMVNGRNKHLGLFDCDVEAAEAYQKELNKINNQ